MFPTLAYQLANVNPNSRKALLKAVREDADCMHGALQKQYNKLIVDSLKAYSASDTVVLVLDALDECISEQGITEILQLLLFSKSTLPCNLLIFITSRPVPYIRSILDDVEDLAEVILHNIDTAIVRDDIMRFLKHELDIIFDKFGMKRPENDDVIRLANGAMNSFLFAAIFLRSIGDNAAKDPEKRLRIILDSLKTDVDIYSAVDSLYLRLLNMAVEDLSLRHTKERIRMVIGTVTTLRTPLPLNAFAIYAKTTRREAGNVLDFLQSFIVVSSAFNNAPCVSHLSFVDFITDKERCTDNLYFVDVPLQENIVAARCLTLMTFCLKENMAEIEDFTLLNNEVTDLDENIKESFEDEHKYACIYWTSHLMAVDHADEDTIDVLNEFLKTVFPTWIEVMSLLGQIPRATSMLRDVHEWAVGRISSIFVTRLIACIDQIKLQYRSD